jgi:3'-5' exoribonuclease
MIEGRVWQDISTISQRLTTPFVAVRAATELWNGQIVLTIQDLESLMEDDIDPLALFESSRWAPHDLLAQLLELIETNVRSPQIRELLTLVLNDEGLRPRLLQAPAAMKNHHAYRGGLLEHILSMARLGVGIAAHYQDYYPGLVNADLVIAGCVLHDLAKCSELSFVADTDYSTEGRLVGHIPMGSEWVSTYANQCNPRLPEDLILQLKHLVLSHHGKQEYGSPVTPLTAEALVLHHIDMLDSRLNMVDNLRPGTVTSSEYWTPYQRSFDGPLYFRGHLAQAWEVKPHAAELEGPGKKRDTLNATNTDLFGDPK